jgi:hypothetical protein
MAPPDSPPPLAWTDPVIVTLAPVATGGWKATVVVGVWVAVMITVPEELGRIGAPGVAAPDTLVSVVVWPPAAAAH